MNPKNKVLIIKYFLYTILIILLFVLQTTPKFLAVFGVKPNFIIPAAICISMLEGEFIGGVFGAVAGVLCDLGGFTLFGFNAIILLIASVAAGLMFIYLLRPGIINFVLMTTGAMAARGLLDFLLNYVMWGYQNVWMVFLYQTLPTILYTAAVSPLIYYLFTWTHRKFESRLQS